MRKRSQRRGSIEEVEQPKKTIKTIRKKPIIKRNQWIAISLVGIFFMVLFLNSYFNIASEVAINPDGDVVSEKFYLSGPDPYYNMRLVNKTLESGKYPFYVAGQEDPLLNYPLGRDGGGRAPLLNMMAIGFSRLLLPFMSEMDAIGYSMQFVPALFGALIVFPIYFIGKTLFGKKEGLIAAMLVAIIPIHIGSGHGSAYALFDHDSLNLFLFFLTFLFLIKSIKEKESMRSLIYAILAGIPLAGLTMVWVESRFLYVVIGLYAILQIFIDIFTSKIDKNVIRNLVIVLLTGYLISMPVRLAEIGALKPDLSVFLIIGVALFGAVALILKKLKIPWIISLPTIICAGGGLYVILNPYNFDKLKSVIPFISPLGKISEILHGSGIYGDKVSGTIAEASTYNISRSVMSYGPAIYWLAWFGLVFLIYQYFKQKGRRDYMVIIALFIIDIWLASTAGRFLNDMVPLIALLGGWITYFAISKIDYKQMFRNIRNAGGGLRGIRKGVKVYPILGILFIVFIVIMPNAFMALDAAVPGASTKNGTSNMKIDYFGEDHSGAFGSSTYKEQYWVDAFGWLNDQDTDIKNPGDRPAFISWWDYGFYGVAIGGHPVVADNFQDGIPAAANFHTAKSEKEAIGVWIVRLLHGERKFNDGKQTTETIETLEKHLGENSTNKIIRWMGDIKQSPSQGKPIGEEYDEDLSKELLVGEQYENAWYHDITNLFNETLDDEGITMLYHDIQKSTGNSIRYYGVEGYDAQIFNIFGYLADKSLVLHALKKGGKDRFYNPEDDFIQIKYTGYNVNQDGSRGSDATWTATELNEMTDEQLRYVAITDTTSENKPDYFKTMFYKTYIGNIPEELSESQITQLPCWEMKHFSAEYVSPYPYFGTGRSAVVIAKYYEGAKINGYVEYLGSPLDAQMVIRKSTPLYGSSLLVDHDKEETVDGNFSLIAPAGDITLEIRRYPEMGLNAFVMKSIVFNSTTDPELASISDDDAMRRDGSNFERTVNITIDPGNFSGYVYKNNDEDEAYNASIDTPLKDVEITLWEITKIDPETGQPPQDASGYGNSERFTSDEQGFFSVSGLMPGIYTIQAILDDFVIHENYVFIYPGNNSYEIAKPKPAAVEGTVYFDENEDGAYNDGEEMGNVDIELLYNKVDGNSMTVNTLTTGESGNYSFISLNPGQYTIKATKTNSNTGYLDYSIETPVTLPENETTSFNVSIDYATIALSGFTTHGSDNVGDITIEFSPDGSFEENTGEELSVTSDEDGSYLADIKPGYYNISIDDTTGEYNAAYSYTGKINMSMGEGIKSFTISMSKETTTVSGRTTYNGVSKDNISISFMPSSDIENNTAESASGMSDETGGYTVELKPGKYDVNVEKTVNESGMDVTYTFSEILEIQETDVTLTYNIALDREEQ